MDAAVSRLTTEQPWLGTLCLLVVWAGLAIGHSLVVLLHAATGGHGTVDTLTSWSMGFAGFALVWAGMKRAETQATILGYLGGNLIWCGTFEWTWRHFARELAVQPVLDNGMIILPPELLVIQSTVLLVISLLIFLGANKDTRCRMFLWFHHNFRLRPDAMTPGFKRQHARNTALETVFLIWAIYLFAIYINDPRGIRYDSMAAMLITVGFVAWGVYLVSKLVKNRGFGPTFRYAIPTGNILWLPIEGFARWGLYEEVWVKPGEYPLLMLVVLAGFAGLISLAWQSGGASRDVA